VTKVKATHEQAAAARHLLATIIEPVRETARKLGYAVAIHGSVARDVDLVAIPWADEAAEPDVLVGAILVATFRAMGETIFLIPVPQGQTSNPEPKPHGRWAWSIHIGPTYIDLSVLPRTPKG
jgi:hypothetical protein